MAFDYYAEGDVVMGSLPPQLFAGDTPAVVTRDVPITNAAAWAQYVPLQRDATTQAWELWEAGNEVAGITAYPIPVGTDVRSAIYLAGMFNIDAIAWPAGTTEAQAEAACRGMIQCRKLLYSDKRTGNETLGVPAGPSLVLVTPSGALADSTEDVLMTPVTFESAEANGAVTWSVASGALPAGTTLNASTGVYSGTPTTVGSYSFVVKAVDADGRVGTSAITHAVVAA